MFKRSSGLGTPPASALQPRLTGDLLIKNVQCVQMNVQKFNEFKSSIPLHFDMLNATPYSLSKEGNIFMVKNTPQGRKDKLDLLSILSHKFRKSRGLFRSTKNSIENQMISL
jgi:hypothetical protein